MIRNTNCDLGKQNTHQIDRVWPGTFYQLKSIVKYVLVEFVRQSSSIEMLSVRNVTLLSFIKLVWNQIRQ